MGGQLNNWREDVRHGANGLKVFKNLGFRKDINGIRVAVDDQGWIQSGK
jgi:hypothetical protein